MKKLILITAALGLTFSGFAQDKYVTSANVALQKNDLDEAKEDIDKAMASPETKEKPKALFVKAEIYSMMQASDKYAASNPYREAFAAVVKLKEVKPDYEKDNVNGIIIGCAFRYFNDGVKDYKAKKYSDAIDIMKNVVKAHELTAGQKFDNIPQIQAVMKQFDTLAAEAGLTMANSAYYSANYEEAIPMLTKVKDNPITKSPAVFQCLIDAYNKQKDTKGAFATIEEARAAYPDDQTIRIYEVNYYINSGKQEDLVKKLEEASAKDPNNAELVFNIATTYLDMANPKDGKKPANYAELTAKSEEEYLKAIKLSPDNGAYNFNLGALYFNQAKDVNDEMNSVTGSSAADQKKYDDLKAKRDMLFNKAMPYFDKAYSIYSPNETTLKGEDKKTYKQLLLAMSSIYATQSKMDKSSEMKKKYESLN